MQLFAAEQGRRALLSPDDIAGAPWVLCKRTIPLAEIPIDCTLAFLDRRIVAVVNDRSSHPAEYRLYDVQELGTARERRQLNLRSGRGRIDVLRVELVDPFDEGVRRVL